MLVRRGFVPKLIGFGFKQGVMVSSGKNDISIQEKERLMEMSSNNLVVLL